jgi:MFS family permease
MFGHRASFGVFIKPLTAEFDWSRALIAGAFSISSLVQGLSCIVTGWLNDRLGPRIVLTICGALVGSGLMLMFFVDSAWKFYLFYVTLIGIGMGGVAAPQMSTIARWFVKRRNIATAVLFVGGGLGGFMGPPLITWLIYTYNWREAFLFVGIGVFAMIILGAQFLRRDPSKMGQVPYGEESQFRVDSPPKSGGLSMRQALLTKKFWIFIFLVFCIGFCAWTIMVHIVPYAIDAGISPSVAAIILSVLNGGMALGSVVVGLIADRVGSNKAFVTCVCLISVIMFLLLPVVSAWLLGIFVIILAFGLGGFSAVQSSMTAELFGMKAHGAILGSQLFILTLGGAVGTFLAGSIFDCTGNYRLILSLCMVLVAVAIILSVLLNRLRKTEVFV